MSPSKALYLALILLSHTAWASLGDFKGNGGDVVSCADGSITVLDVFESAKLDLPPQPDLESLFLKPLENVGQFHLAQHLRERAARFIEDAVFISSDLGDVADEGDHAPLPSNCKLEQIANQNPSLLPPGKRYIINQRLWDKLDSLNRLTLIFHELLYSFSKSPSSKALRMLNQALLENTIGRWTGFEVFEHLSTAGLPLFTQNRFPIVLDSTAHWLTLANGERQLTSGTSAAGETYLICGNLVPLEKHSIAFSASGHPRSVWVEGTSVCQLRSGLSVQIETDFWGQEKGIELFDDGSIHRLPVSYREHQSFLPEAPRTRAKRLTLDAAGDVVAVTASDADFTFGLLYRLQTHLDIEFKLGGSQMSFSVPYPLPIRLQKHDLEIKADDTVIHDASQNSLEFTADRSLALKTADGRIVRITEGERVTIHETGALLR